MIQKFTHLEAKFLEHLPALSRAWADDTRRENAQVRSTGYQDQPSRAGRIEDAGAMQHRHAMGKGSLANVPAPVVPALRSEVKRPRDW